MKYSLCAKRGKIRVGKRPGKKTKSPEKRRGRPPSSEKENPVSPLIPERQVNLHLNRGTRHDREKTLLRKKKKGLTRKARGEKEVKGEKQAGSAIQ